MSDELPQEPPAVAQTSETPVRRRIVRRVIRRKKTPETDGSTPSTPNRRVVVRRVRKSGSDESETLGESVEGVRAPRRRVVRRIRYSRDVGSDSDSTGGGRVIPHTHTAASPQTKPRKSKCCSCRKVFFYVLLLLIHIRVLFYVFYRVAHGAADTVGIIPAPYDVPPSATFTQTFDGNFLREKMMFSVEAKIRGIVLYVHGLDSHMEMNFEDAARFNSEGYHVVLFDHRGHGYSSGMRLQVKSFSEYAGDIQHMIGRIRENLELKDLPIVILAESLGTMMNHYLELTVGLRNIDTKIAGLISVSTAVCLVGDPDPVTIAIGKTLNPIIPDYEILPALVLEGLTDNEEFRNTMLTDPLRSRVGTRISWGLAFLDAYELITNNLINFEVPTLYLHGSKDVVCSAEFVESVIFAGNGAYDKTFELFEGVHHSMFRGYDGNLVFKKALEWINSHVEVMM